ncbi:MAG: polynucleotide kinase-phosphatase [Hyphomicrobiaceae bacterium]|nr:polynucleotide kinase-phosphatase [Hyphomicrobiaceae bacterium]
MQITIPEFCLVALIGPSGSGKSTFARAHFQPTEVISSDYCRAVVSDDENDQAATDDAFRLLHEIARTRLKRRKLVVVDATNVRQEDRAELVRIAKEYHALAVAIVIDPGEDVAIARNKVRTDRRLGAHVVRNQMRSLKRNIRRIDKEGFRTVFELRTVEEIDAAVVERQRLWTDRRNEMGPFDIIGDVHGCRDELEALLDRLGYRLSWTGDGEARACHVTPPASRRAVFVGDLVDRGPASPDVLRIVMGMVGSGAALSVPGNHDVKFLRWLNGRDVKLTHGLEKTVAQMECEPASFRQRVRTFIDGLVSHIWLDGGRLVVAHAGIRDEMIGRSSGAVREFCLYGETSGETDQFGLPIRYNWAAEYKGQTTVVYGHTPVPEAEWLNNTLCVDTGCVFGGKLTALRWPEKEIVSVPAAATYAVPIRPLGHPPVRPGATLSQQARHDDLLDLADFTGKLLITTSAGRTVQIAAENAAAALEVMSRFAVNPKWLIHLPPTMSPCETSTYERYLEHPEEAFAYFEREGISEVVCEEKHMGSRALAIVCRDADEAARTFGIATGETGAIFTRTGRAFLPDAIMTEGMLSRIRSAMNDADFWERHDTGWALFDAEILPWSAKARQLIRTQYAATGAAATAGLSASVALLEAARHGGADVDSHLARFTTRLERAERYVDAYRRYCWPVTSLDDYRFAPFHLLATEGQVHTDKDHIWHMHELNLVTSGARASLMATHYREVSLADPDDRERATQWWIERTADGGEGMVVKPLAFAPRGSRGLIQPAIKVRGPEYLRIIYGPEYDSPEHLTRLRKRALGHKRALAIREFVLGEEALRRFIAKEPLRRVHECVFAILALESEPVDPRL